jgi:hypothetical protein
MRKLGGVLTAIAVAMVLFGMAPRPSSAANDPATADNLRAAVDPAAAPKAKVPRRRAVRTRAYDGIWSVSIFTKDGPCAASYRYPARILNGQVVQAEPDITYQLAGAVTSAGGISVTVSSGGQSATGYGRLTRTKGGGWWRAAGGACSGIWNAMRRS